MEFKQSEDSTDFNTFIYLKHTLGERALRDILKRAREIGALSKDPKIIALCNELDGMVDKLADLRQRGLVCYFFIIFLITTEKQKLIF